MLSEPNSSVDSATVASKSTESAKTTATTDENAVGNNATTPLAISNNNDNKNDNAVDNTTPLDGDVSKPTKKRAKIDRTRYLPSTITFSTRLTKCLGSV